jgi:hypothetical protein
MTILQALSGAARRVNARKRMIVLYWFCQTVIAALAALPLLGAAVPMLAHSTYASELLKQFDVTFIMEAMQVNHHGAPAIATAVYILLAGAGLLSAIFLSGGAVTLVVHDAISYSPREFWSACGENFWRFFRLFLYSLLLFSAARAVTAGLGKIPDKLWGEGTQEIPLAVSSYVVQALTFVLFGIVMTAMDYAKVRLVRDESRKSLRACFGSLSLVLRKPLKPLGAAITIAAILLVFTVVYQPVANRIEPASLGFILFLALWQQLYVVARVWLRFLAWGTAAELDPILRPRPLPPEEFVPAGVRLSPEPPELEAGAAEDFAI